MSARDASQTEATLLEMQQAIVTAQRTEALVRPGTRIFQAALDAGQVNRDALNARLVQSVREHEQSVDPSWNHLLTRRKFDSTCQLSDLFGPRGRTVRWTIPRRQIMEFFPGVGKFPSRVRR